MKAPTVAALEVESLLKAVEETIARQAHCDEPLLSRMALDVVEAGGKRLRPRVCVLAYLACGGGKENAQRVVDISAGLELIHTATLVHDDIIDQSPLRRGHPTLHVKYGIPHAIVAGDYLFTRGFALAGNFPREIVDMAAEACTFLAEGQVMEQRLIGGDLDVERYLKIIAKKTAEPFRACARIGASLAGADARTIDELGDYGLEMGIAFQIQDDLLDITGDPTEMGKASGTDAKTGVLTLPALIASQRPTAPGGNGNGHATGQPGDLLLQAQEIADRYAQRAKAHLNVVAPGPAREALADLADLAVRRKK